MTIEKFSTISLILCAGIAHSIDMQAITPPHIGSVRCGQAGIDSTEAGGEASRAPGNVVAGQAQSFGIGKSDISGTEELSRLSCEIDSLYKSGSLESVAVDGTASPDGPPGYNDRLALRRAESVCGFLKARTGLPDSIFTVSSSGEDWESLRGSLSACLDDGSAKAVEDIIDSVADLDLREKKLRLLDGGRVWRRLSADLFPHLRKSTIVMALKSGGRITYTLDSVGQTTSDKELPAPVPVALPEPETAPVGEIAVETETEVIVMEPEAVVRSDSDPEPRHWYLKTNIPAWGMLWSNVQAELDLADHWSVMLPVYYSGWNYFTSTRKFRTLTVMPEARFWPRADNQGFFVGAHVGFCYYNVAYGSKRYQDHDRRTPALGGGLNAGYRMALGRSGCWHLEFSVGAGVYSLDYDTFENRHNGLLIDRTRDTFVGIDNVAVSVAYRFDISRKGGDR